MEALKSGDPGAIKESSPQSKGYWEVFSLLRPYVAEWFRRKYGEPTEPQRLAIPLVKAGYNVLISSPTGTGKTLAAFLGVLDELYRMGEEGLLGDNIYVVYVSPLRALNNDMRRNLLEPLEEIRRVAEELGFEAPDIRVAVRTSDTTPSEKQRMLVSPPHILITTPESLSISLSAPKFRERLSSVRWVIIDEIHEIASSKRGAHLMLSVERLENLVREGGGEGLQRIGLSATIAPLEVVAEFLGGYNDDGTPRPVRIVDARFSKPIDIRVVTPDADLLRDPPERVNEAIYRKLAELIRSHRTTLVFTNTRSATERVVYKLKKVLSEEKIADMDEIEAHHSSLSRSLRLEVEERLKSGDLKVVVSSTSLELGIDIGYIDLVALLSSPKSVSRLLQRVGRAGHRLNRVSKGRIIVVDRDDLIECAVLAKSAMDRFIDSVRIPRKPLDVLAQHIVGMATERRWRLDEAYRLVKRAYNYRDLGWEEFLSVVRFMAGSVEDPRGRASSYSKIWIDEDDGVFGAKRGSRMIYQLNSGVIPDEMKIDVYTVDRKYVGQLEEGFAEILSAGDVFVLGGKTYKVVSIDSMKVVVAPVESQRPTVPTWFSEMLPLSFDSALRVGRFRRMIARLLEEGRRYEAFRLLVDDYRLEPRAANAIIEYIWEQLAYVGVIPGDDLVMVEYHRGDDGSWNIVFHTLYGRRTNDALSRAVASLLSRRVMAPVRVTVSDNGFMLSYDGARPTKELIEGLFKDLNPDGMRALLEDTISRTELMRRRFRHVAERMFMILKRYRGVEKSPERRQASSRILLEIMMNEYPDSPVIRETYREILEDYMNIDTASRVIDGMRSGRIKLVIVGELPYPSPMAHHLVVKGYSDVVLMEDRRKLLLALHEKVMKVIEMRGRRVAGLKR